ncbi:MAG: TetR/AcrR family transcriptional regulator [Solirubrobacterales bacterium]|nr:TetR/AcrR family transcriptional regulator [Solirubrobacterales bacterium]
MSAKTPGKGRRPYEKRRRAEQEQATRERITAAAVELHGTVGPAATTVSEVAKLAGVQRATVYRHFPDADDLFEACSSHWADAHPPPDMAPLAEIEDPRTRLAAALAGLYAYYRENETMLSNVFRDMPRLPGLAAATARRRAGFEALEQLLGHGWEGGDPELRAAAISLALDYRAWELLVRERGLDDAGAAALMVAAATCAGR